MKGTTTKRRRDTNVTGFKKLGTKGRITEYELAKNGLRVLCVRIPDCPTVTTNIVYHVGSQHEKTGETGLSHMLEHMLFKPTSGTGPKWKDLENRGALMNATTWLDRTLYYFTMPNEYLSDMLAVEADRMRNLILTDTEFLPERANVLSEYEMYNSEPPMALEWHMVAAAFESHGYHHDTIGWKSDIEAYTTTALKRYYDTYYHPENATLIIAGDIPDADALALVQRHFGALERGPVLSEALPRAEPPQEGTRRVELKRSTPLRLINLAFKAPAFTDQRWVALMVVLRYLADGETSPLHERLVDTHLATSVATNLYPTKDPFLAFVTAYAAEKTPYARIESIVLEEIQTLAASLIPARRFALIKEQLFAEDLFARDGSHAVALALGEFVATGSWERYETHLAELEALTREAVREAVCTFLTLDQATIGTLIPRS